MNVDFVPYEEALELKALGFDEPCFGRFYSKPKCKMFSVDEKGRHYQIKNTPKKLYTVGEYFVLNDDNAITAPTFSQAFRWFRGQSIPFSIVNDHSFNLTPYTFTTDHEYYYDSGSGNPWYETYEEAELACLRKLIEIIKSQKE